MAKVMTLDGVSEGLGAPRRRKRASSSETPRVGECKDVYNPRTKRHARLCFVGKSTKNRSGWQFQKRR